MFFVCFCFCCCCDGSSAVCLFVFVGFYRGNGLAEVLEFQVKGGEGLLESVFIFHYQLFYMSYSIVSL